MSWGSAASCHGGLIPLKTAYKKEKRIAPELVHTYKFRIFQKTARARAYETWKLCQ